MSNIQDEVVEFLREFLSARGTSISGTFRSLNLIDDLGLESDEGLELALDLEDRFQIIVPKDVNPIVNEAAQKGATVDEFVGYVCSLVGHGE